jgi:antagonist of KipI
MSSSILIEQAGMLTTIQDTGRVGFQQFGMPVCGAMDTLSCQLANLLLGNDPGAACLETTIVGPTIRFNSQTYFAITGADLQPMLNKLAIAHYTPFLAHQNDVLSFKGIKTGCRAYIAFSGGIDVPAIMGSKSTYLLGNVGGYYGRALKNGDVVPIIEPAGKPPNISIPLELYTIYNQNEPVRIIPGPEATRYRMRAYGKMLETTYTISTNSNRMGYRLNGKPIKIKDDLANIISSSTPPGTIQLPADGLPIILLADRQTTGGYARLGVVASVDLPVVAQLMPGESIRFQEIKVEQAQALYLEQQMMLKGLK